MFVARNHKGLLCNALEEKIEKGADFVCPACSGAVCFKKGKVMQPHFAHISLEECRFYRENEQDGHRVPLLTYGKGCLQGRHIEITHPATTQTNGRCGQT